MLSSLTAPLRFARRLSTFPTLARPSTGAGVATPRLLSSTPLRFNQQQQAQQQTEEQTQGEGQQTTGEQQILQILTQRFKPGHLKVQDVSGGCGSFYAIAISSKEFKGLSTIKAHRLVNGELKDVIKNIHGLQLRTIAED